MLNKTRGIVFRTVKYSETSLICDIYTESLGLKSFIISGVRTMKPKVAASLLQVMTLVELVVYHRENRPLNRIKEIKPSVLYQAIPFEVLKSAVGLFMVELARKTIREVEPNPLLFEFLFDSFEYLDTMQEGAANFHLYFALHLTRHLGFLPGGEYEQGHSLFDLEEGLFCNIKPRHPHFLDKAQADLMSQFLYGSAGNVAKLALSRNQRSRLLESILIYYRYHIENFKPMQSHQVLREVLG